MLSKQEDLEENLYLISYPPQQKILYTFLKKGLSFFLKKGLDFFRSMIILYVLH